MPRYIVTGTSMVVEADSEEEAINRAQDSSGWHWEAQEYVWTPPTGPENCPIRHEHTESC